MLPRARTLSQDIQASELQHAELEEAAAARQRQRDQDLQRAAAALQDKEVLEAAVVTAERRLALLQQQAQVGCDCDLGWEWPALCGHVWETQGPSCLA